MVGDTPVNVRGVGEGHEIVKQTDFGFGVDTQAGPEGHPSSSGSPCPPDLSHMALSWVGTPVLAPGSRPLLLLPPIPPSTRVFSNESALRIRWPKN